MRTHPSWVEVSLPTLQQNFRTVAALVQPEADVCAVVKSDAYGHGAAECARALQEAGAKWFGVTTTEEGVALREKGITGRILLMGGYWKGEEEAVLEHRLTPAVWEPSHVKRLENTYKMLKWDFRPSIHVKVNTGMNRLGVDLKDLPALLTTIKTSANVEFDGIFSHFASSEVIDSPQSRMQVEQFREALKIASQMNLATPMRHMANSAAVATLPQARFDLVRTGLALYGYHLPLTSAVTGSADSSLDIPVTPVLSWKTRVVQVREVAAGQPVGYTSGYLTRARTRVAVVSVGYSDGLNRALSSRGRVIIRDESAPIIGNVSMTLTAIDVTSVPGVEVGDEVILIGTTPKRKLTVWEHASLASTIPYDILCGISERLPRRYEGMSGEDKE